MEHLSLFIWHLDTYRALAGNYPHAFCVKSNGNLVFKIPYLRYPHSELRFYAVKSCRTTYMYIHILYPNLKSSEDFNNLCFKFVFIHSVNLLVFAAVFQVNGAQPCFQTLCVRPYLQYSKFSLYSPIRKRQSHAYPKCTNAQVMPSTINVPTKTPNIENFSSGFGLP